MLIIEININIDINTRKFTESRKEKSPITLTDDHRLSPIITDYHRLSPNITEYHRLSPIIGEYHRISPIIIDHPSLSSISINISPILEQ